MRIKLPLLFCLFLLPVLSFSQTISDLGSKKQRIEQKIEILEDSLHLVEEKIEVLEEQRNSEKDIIEVSPEIEEWTITKDAVLLSAPNVSGKSISELKKGTIVQKVDQLGAYYLVCISGECGYIHQGFLESNIEEKKMNKRSIKDGEENKGFMG